MANSTHCCQDTQLLLHSKKEHQKCLSRYSQESASVLRFDTKADITLSYLSAVNGSINYPSVVHSTSFEGVNTIDHPELLSAQLDQ